MSQPTRTEFSYRGRAHNLARLRAEQFDLLIIGGGITGAGIARDAALRGYKVALVERDDFASGTSSRSTKLVHGGLRYLETYRFHLVYEASRERRILNQLAPTLVKPLPFLYPIYRGSLYGPFLTRLGFLLYDSLALFRNFGPHHILSSDEVGRRVTELDRSDIIGGATYYDAQTDDARLTLENARSAHRNGAVVVNHFRIDELGKNKSGQVNGACGHDSLTGETFEIRARIVVNATGPWADAILRMDDPHFQKRVRPSKGVHLYVPRDRFPLETALAFRVKKDNRLMFALPWGRQTIIGTTDTFYDGDPDQVYADAADVRYILDSTNSAFPNAKLGPGDIVSTFAGLRPLIITGNANGPGAISREHRIWTTPSGLMNIAGGKLTTYRSMAQELVDKVAARLKRDYNLTGTPVRSIDRPLIEADPGNDRARDAVKRTLSPEVLDHLVGFYGPRHGRVLDYITQNEKGRSPIVEGLPYIWAEVPHAIENEMALTVRDVLERRLHLLYEAPDGGMGVAAQVSQEVDRRLDLGPTEIDRQLQDFAVEVNRSRESIRAVEAGT